MKSKAEYKTPHIKRCACFSHCITSNLRHLLLEIKNKILCIKFKSDPYKI